jgi:hypothetical protein
MGLARDLDDFYGILGELSARLGGTRVLRDCDARTGWPKGGVYFFFEAGQRRGDGTTPRVVRVGTHGVSTGSKATLWSRLKQHRGTGTRGVVGAGNHRGSIFRLHVGHALIRAGRLSPLETWGKGSSAPAEVRVQEDAHERAVSAVLGAMELLVVKVEDTAGPASSRARIERNSLGLLASARDAGLEEPSTEWLGHHALDNSIPRCGLWNVRATERSYERDFLLSLAKLARETGGPT